MFVLTRLPFPCRCVPGMGGRCGQLSSETQACCPSAHHLSGRGSSPVGLRSLHTAAAGSSDSK